MSTRNDYTESLSTEAALERLATKTLGRLVVRSGEDVELFPLNYTVHDGKIFFRTAEGTKLFHLAFHKDVLIEADDADLDESVAWSVIVKGEARILTSHSEVLAAEDLPLKPWTPSLKYNFVEITPREVSGRVFRLGEEPQRF